MKVTLSKTYCTIQRMPGDPRISHESTVMHHLKRELNREFRKVRCVEKHCGGFGNDHLVPWKFVRMNPSRHGLTACERGLVDHRAGVVIWHERYAVEDLAREYNSGAEVTLQVVRDASN